MQFELQVFLQKLLPDYKEIKMFKTWMAPLLHLVSKGSIDSSVIAKQVILLVNEQSFRQS